MDERGPATDEQSGADSGGAAVGPELGEASPAAAPPGPVPSADGGPPSAPPPAAGPGQVRTADAAAPSDGAGLPPAPPMAPGHAQPLSGAASTPPANGLHPDPAEGGAADPALPAAPAAANAGSVPSGVAPDSETPGTDAAAPHSGNGGGPPDASGTPGEPEGPSGAAEDGAPSVPMAVTPALRSVLAWSDIVSDEGEDDLEPFPVPADHEEEEEEPLQPSVDGAGEAEEPTADAPEPAEAGEGAVATATELVPVEAAPVPAAAGGGTGGGDGGGPRSGAGAGGDRPRGRRRTLLEIVDQPMTIVEHLDELRRRLVWAVIAFVVGTGITFGFIHPVLNFTMRPLTSYGVHLQTITPMEPLFATVRLAAVGGLLLGSPIIVYELVMYILPALTRRERRMLFSYLPATSLLFAVGLAFGYFVFEPVALRVAIKFLPEVIARPTLNNWVSFLIEYSVPFGLVFELPVVVVVLTRLGILSSAVLAKWRRYAIFGAVVVGEIFSPPADFIFTPSLIALPIIALWEISIQAARVAERRRAQDQRDEEDESTDG